MQQLPAGTPDVLIGRHASDTGQNINTVERSAVVDSNESAFLSAFGHLFVPAETLEPCTSPNDGWFPFKQRQPFRETRTPSRTWPLVVLETLIRVVPASTALDGRPLALNPRWATTMVDVGVDAASSTSSTRREDEGSSVAPAPNVTVDDPAVSRARPRRTVNGLTRA